MVKISVIIPVYGIQFFVGRCAESLFSQTLQNDVEFIFVDDATPDDSVAVIENVLTKFPERTEQVTILHHKENHGLPAARNTGLEVANGEYIYHFDGDDFAEPELLERMLKTAEETDADYVWADWILSYEHSDRLMYQPKFDNVDDLLKGMLTGKVKYNVWNKIVKRSLYIENDILFPDGFGMGEDMTMIRLLACAKKVVHCDYAGYHYVRTNNQAMTANVTSKSLEDIKHNVELTLKFLHNKKREIYNNTKDQFKLSIKYSFLYSGKHSDFLSWTELWPESNEKISTNNGFRSYALQIIAKHRIWWLINLHFHIHNFLYSLKYKY